MNRRSFLRSAIAISVAAALPALPPSPLELDPRGLVDATRELLEGNSLLSIDMIMREALREMHNTTNFLAAVNREYDPRFAIGGSSAVRVRTPKRYRAVA